MKKRAARRKPAPPRITRVAAPEGTVQAVVKARQDVLKAQLVLDRNERAWAKRLARISARFPKDAVTWAARCVAWDYYGGQSPTGWFDLNDLVDIHRENVLFDKERVVAALVEFGYSERRARARLGNVSDAGPVSDKAKMTPIDAFWRLVGDLGS